MDAWSLKDRASIFLLQYLGLIAGILISLRQSIVSVDC